MRIELLNDFLSLIFPRCCAGCQKVLLKQERSICMVCLANLPHTNYHHDVENPVSEKFIGAIDVKYAFSFLKFIKGGLTQRLIHQLKYEGNEDIGELLGKLYGMALRNAHFHDKFDLILPVPLHKNKLRQRGYNQCDAIVRGLSESVGIEFNTSILVRKIENVSQTKTQGKLERRENVDGIFDVIDQSILGGKNILLVDDVLTTGATLESCAQPILASNCKSLSIATIAITSS